MPGQLSQKAHPQKGTAMINERETHHHVVTSYKYAPTRTIAAGGVNFAYRELGPATGVPVIFLTHLAAVLDNWDPRVVDGIAAQHPVITFDNTRRPHRRSGGSSRSGWPGTRSRGSRVR
jgi:hypothetical protein